MKKSNKKDTVNLFFSAFLVIAYIVCAHFFTQFAATLNATAGSVVSICIYAIFGLLVFYATRVGDGKAIKRFSPVTLIVMVLPSLYIIIASIAPGLPLNSVFASTNGTLSVIVSLACVALGYGIPYTFLSGFETELDEVEQTEEPEVVEGGIEEEIAEAQDAADSEADTEEVSNDSETEADIEAEEEAADTDEADEPENSEETEEA